MGNFVVVVIHHDPVIQSNYLIEVRCASIYAHARFTIWLWHLS